MEISPVHEVVVVVPSSERQSRHLGHSRGVMPSNDRSSYLPLRPDWRGAIPSQVARRSAPPSEQGASRYQSLPCCRHDRGRGNPPKDQISELAQTADQCCAAHTKCTITSSEHAPIPRIRKPHQRPGESLRDLAPSPRIAVPLLGLCIAAVRPRVALLDVHMSKRGQPRVYFRF